MKFEKNMAFSYYYICVPLKMKVIFIIKRNLFLLLSTQL